MLTTTNALFDSARQLAGVATQCKACGIGFQRVSTAKRKLCKVCDASYSREWLRDARGYSVRLGEVAACDTCGESFQVNGPGHRTCQECTVKKGAGYSKKYRAKLAAQKPEKVAVCTDCSASVAYTRRPPMRCDECKLIIRRKRSKERSRAERNKAGMLPLGIKMDCTRCGAGTIRTSGSRLFCDSCQRHALKVRSDRADRKRRSSGKAAAYLRKRSARDPRWQIHARMSTGIRRSLADIKKGRSWEGLVGYSAKALLVHLERQFLPGMSWANRQLWHIDHILPLASFTFTSADDPEFRAAWALTNLRPLWKNDNLAKSDKRLFLL